MSLYADIILPLALPNRTYTYSVPEGARALVQPGVRVEVQFGRSKLYSGLVERVHDKVPDYTVKPVISVLDDVNLINAQQLQFWDWLADYYCCTLGEVMAAAVPGQLRLSSETKIVLNEAFGDDFNGFDADEYLIGEALLVQQEITVEDARKILNKKTVFPVIQRLLNKGVLFLREDLQEKFRPKKISAVRLAEPYRSQPERLREIMGDLEKKERQLEILMAYLTLEKQQSYVRRQDVLTKADVTESSLNTLIKKGILEKYERETSRLGILDENITEADTMSGQQQRAIRELQHIFYEKDQNVALLYGVTGSGKTRVYIELIREVMRQGGQVLYLLPEIALTAQVTHRLQRVFGADLAVYHSKINHNERVEVWKSASAGKPLILAARSGLFLPFKDLRLIIVDEEHDASFKQYDPAPRYHARDAAIFLAHIYKAKTLLGTATPSIESWHNVLTNKYGLVEMPERFGEAQLPEIQMVDLREVARGKQMQSIFAPILLEKLKVAITAGEQAILFQNRRGYAPMLECQVCNWTAQCQHCDVSLTYHKYTNRLRCHYCGYVQEVASTCPACGSGKITLRGFGTEKIEDEIKIFLPDARIGRMDMDTAGSKGNLATLLNDFEEGRIDVLVGTQMVTKGLDFDNVALVGVLGADQLTKFPDFRSGERAFQLLTQVAGRAGRKSKRGQVLIQAWEPTHPVLRDVLADAFRVFAKRELAERQEFKYPPFYRLIHLVVKHKDPKMVHQAAADLARVLRSRLGERVLGPVQPHTARLRGYFLQDIMLKLEKSAPLLANTKIFIKNSVEQLLGKSGYSQVIVAIDVDPM